MRQDLGKRFYLGVTNWLMRTGLGPSIQRALGEPFIGRVRNFFFGHPNRIETSASSIALPLRPAVHQAETSYGLNVVGYLRDETGVGEAARAVLQALHRQGFPVAYTDVRSYTARKNDTSVLHLPTGHPYDFNLFHVNADQVPVVYNQLGPEFFAGKYNVGFWFWELARFPEQWLDRFNYFNEIWVGTSFAQTTLAHVSPIPVINVRMPIEKYPDPAITRQSLGLPEDRFLFLFVFDMLSIIERKNPFGLIEAYRRAFEPCFKDTTLVIKVTKLDEFPQYQKPLREAIASVSGILLGGYLDRRDLDGLFNVCDAYVSLHRSEGFGLTMAEAMCLGKPVIATAYSANMDFMTVANSYPVEYRLVELERDYGPYRKGEVWADPDIDHAAALMRRVFENRDEAAQKGARAAADMRRLYSPEAVAQRIIQRLQYIARHRTGQGR